jgi:hypothetical protein
VPVKSRQILRSPVFIKNRKFLSVFTIFTLKHQLRCPLRWNNEDLTGSELAPEKITKNASTKLLTKKKKTTNVALLFGPLALVYKSHNCIQNQHELAHFYLNSSHRIASHIHSWHKTTTTTPKQTTSEFVGLQSPLAAYRYPFRLSIFFITFFFGKKKSTNRCQV